MLRKSLLSALLLCAALSATAQNFSTVTASNIKDAGGTVLAAGTICFLGTDQRDQVINFQAGGGGQVINTPACATVAGGAITSPNPFTIANPAATVPAGIYYRVTTTNTSTGRIVRTDPLVQWSGATFNWDLWSPPGAGTSPPTGAAINGPFTINGDVTVTGACNGCGSGGGGGGFYQTFLNAASLLTQRARANFFNGITCADNAVPSPARTDCQIDTTSGFSPTWAGNHTFNGNTNIAGGFKINGAAPLGKLPIGDGTNYVPGDPLVQGTQTEGSTAAANPINVGGYDTAGTPALHGTKVLNSTPAGTEYGVVTRNIPSGTQAVSAAALPLPTGAAQDATLTGGSQKTKIVDSGGTNVATVSAAGAVKVDNSGVTQPVSAASLPLPTGAAQDSTLTGGSQKAIARGGQKGATNANADITHTAEGADHEAMDVQIMHGGVAKDPTQTRALTNSDVVKAQIQDNAGNGLASSTSAPAGTEQALIVRNIPSGTQTADVSDRAARLVGKVSAVDSGGTDATDTTNHAIKVNVVAGGGTGGGPADTAANAAASESDAARQKVTSFVRLLDTAQTAGSQGVTAKGDQTSGLWVNCKAGCSAAGDTATGSTALGALNAAIAVALAGESGATFQVQSGGTGVYTVTPQCSFDGGTIYNINGYIQDPISGALSLTATIASAQATTDYPVLCPPHASHAQMKVTAYTSGSANWLARSTVNNGPALAFAAVSATAPSLTDGKIAPLSEDTGGNLRVVNNTGDTAGTLGSLNALNAASSVALTGLQGAGVLFSAASSPLLTVVPELSFDGATTWTATYFYNPATGAAAASLVNPANGQYGIIGASGASHARVRVSAFTSGSISATLRSSMTLGPAVNIALLGGNVVGSSLPVSCASGATCPVNATLQAGSAIVGKVGIDQTTPGTTNGVQVNAALPTGANVIGKVGIDQTTPGTTNGVQVNAALPAGANRIGKTTIRNSADSADIDPLADSTFTGRINTQGQKAMAASTPVVLPSDQVVAVQGASSDNSANSTAKQPTLPAIAKSANPSWTDGNQVPLIVDPTTGGLKVSGLSSGVEQVNNSSGSATNVGYNPGSLPVPTYDPATVQMANVLLSLMSNPLYARQILGAFGRPIGSTGDALNVSLKDPRAGCAGASALATNTTPFSISTATTALVIPKSTAPTFICFAEVIVSGADNVALIYGTTSSTPCDTGATGVSGGSTAATGWNFAANGGKTTGSGTGVIYRVPAGKDVCLATSAAVQASGSFTWVQPQ